MPDDVWDGFSRVCGTFKERTGWHPCQMPENLLKRIITASSNPGDFVLDPFCGSGTTASAAYQLGRYYVGVEISEQYVEKSKKRLAELKKPSPAVLLCETKQRGLDRTELNELKQLSVDMGKSLKEIAEDKNLLEIFTNQFSVRMNGRKKYSSHRIATAVKDLAD